MARRLAGLIVCLWLASGPVLALEVTVAPVSLSRFFPARKTYGKLVWRGGLRLQSSDRRFGGFSGIVVSSDGKKLVALSDRGWWLAGKLFSKGGVLSGAGGFVLAPVKTSARGRPGKNWQRDGEALAPWSKAGLKGDLVAGFERQTRVLRYRFAKSGVAARPYRVRFPKAVARGPVNKTLEAVARFYAGPRRGWLVAISEGSRDEKNNSRAWLWRKRRTISFSVRRHEDYDVTGMAVLPDGKSFVTIERSFNPPALPGMAIRLFKTADIAHGKTIEGKILFSGRQLAYAIDNMEGIAVSRADNGKIQLTVISDDNYNRSLQSTLIFRFEMDNPL